MRINRIKLIAEMARQEVSVKELSEKAGISRCALSALRGGKSCTENTAQRVAAALGVTVDDLKED